MNYACDMGELARFVHRGAATVTPKTLRGLQSKLPLLKLEFANSVDTKYPHLAEQLPFLVTIVEDFLEGAADDLPLVVVASAAFAIIYCHRQFDLIPDSVPEFGHADDSGVVRVVLIEYEKVLSAYCAKLGLNWSRVSTKP